MCRKHNPTRRHRRIKHGRCAVEAEEGFGSMVVPQVCGAVPEARIVLFLEPHAATRRQCSSRVVLCVACREDVCRW